MNILAATHSSFPRVGDSPDEQKLRRAYSGLEKGRVSDEEFRNIENELAREVIALQEEAGCEVVTDGMIRWYDHASHIATHLSGFEINGLLRFFDTNYYYRQPVAGENIGRGNDGLADEARFTAENTSRRKKAILLGPYSLARMSQNKSSMDFDRFCEKLAEILAVEVGSIAGTGTDYIQIEEPAFVREPGDPELLKSVMSTICAARGRAKIILAFYFGDCGRIIDRLTDVPADMFGFDFTYSPGLIERLKTGDFEKPIAFGLLDGRNTKMESAHRIADSLEGVLSKIEAEECHITTSCGLEFLPRNYALKKLQLAAEAASLLNG